ncbi:5-hydroxytryptamine receptor 3A-like [Pyxicephalus adspersus]|uniref:5-hydroxytryptamine receptor 3A-like n=1 Tax=Pyxicephalus adspersus TaxID=30357 RepID=UPI003B5B42E9
MGLPKRSPSLSKLGLALERICHIETERLLAASMIAGAKACLNSTNISSVPQLRLLRDLEKDYEKELRPVKDWKSVSFVYVDIIIYSILLVNEKDQIMTVYFMYTRLWKDDFLQWNPENYGNISVISRPKTEIWIPDIRVDEFFDSNKDLEHSFVYINSTGWVNYQKKLRMTISCMFNIYLFPFDVHACNLSFQSQLHTIEHMNITSLRTEQELNKDLGNFYQKGEWKLLNIKPIHTLWEDHQDKNAMIVFQITFRRHPLYYVVNLLTPSIFLMIISLAGFYIPPNSGERISFMVTVLLGYSVFLVIVSETSPPAAHGTPIIDMYFLVCMALLVISLMESIFIVRLVNKKDFLAQIPTWFKDLSLGKISPFLCNRKNNHSTNPKMNICDEFQDMENRTGELTTHMVSGQSTKNSSEGNISMKEYGMLENILQEIVRIRQNIEDNDQQTNSEILQVIFAVDKLLFRIYLVTILAYTITLTLLWSFNSST